MIRYLLCICTLLFAATQLLAQMKPIALWSFEQPGMEQRSGTSFLRLKSDNQISSKDGVVGNYLTVTEATSGRYYFKNIVINKAFTLEFWLRIPQGALTEKMSLFAFDDQSFSCGFQFPFLYFNTNINTSQGKKINDSWRIRLDGVARESYQYYADGQWHHWVIKYHAGTGKKEIWVDGVCPSSFAKEVSDKGNMCFKPDCKRNMSFAHAHPKGFFTGDVDEIALYDRIVPEQLHYQHYLDGQAGQTYSSEVIKNRTIPSQTITSSTIDQREYAPSHPSVKVSALQQLQQFPLPRYKPGHGLHRHYNWLEAAYLGGARNPGVSNEQAIKGSTDIQEELALHWHYMLVISNANFARDPDNPYFIAWTDLANRYPDIPLGVTTLWAQVIYKTRQETGTGKSQTSNIRNGQLSDHSYLRNKKGQFVDSKGKITTTNKQISPAFPAQYLIEDGKLQGQLLNKIQSRLTRDIQMINENGEVPFLAYSDKVLEQDPSLVKDKAKSKAKDWAEYQAIKKTAQRVSYRNAMLKEANLEGVEFSWYAVDAAEGPLNRFSWIHARDVQTPMDGQYYSTPDFYPRWPKNWFKWSGAWRGWAWMEECRPTEIENGDALFSPFVAAGWNHDPEINVRPSQYLGLLKNLGVIGAEFFYPGYFNVNKTVSKPQNYIWQAAIPSYAQAVTSRYEEVLRNGNLLLDDQGNSIVRTQVGNPEILATVRKHNDQAIYVIGSTIQPISNKKGVVPDEQSIWIPLDNLKIKIKTRRQGSIYYFDRRNPNKPVLIQLDAWHETGHPAYWTKDFAFEAEVYDFAQEVEIQTERPDRAPADDFTSFTSFLSPQGSDACAKYIFEPRSKQQNTYQVQIRARRKASSTGTTEVLLDGKSIGNISTIRSSEWKWYTLKTTLKNLSPEPHMLAIHLPEGIELDQITLKQR